MLKTLIVDDEPLAHQVISHHLASHEDIKIVGHCYDATEVMNHLANNTVDLLFLDINMPALSGIDMLKLLANPPQVIIVSAYEEYAIDGFELDVIDYLLKPVTSKRLAQAVDKVRARTQLPASFNTRQQAETSIVLKVDRGKRKFNLSEITYFQSYGNYVKVWQNQQVILANSTLKLLLTQLPSLQFVQIHKSFIVNTCKVIAVDKDVVTLECGSQIKIGKSFKSKIQKML